MRNTPANRRKSSPQSIFAGILFWWGAVLTGFGFIALFTEPSSKLPSLMMGFLIIGVVPLLIGYNWRRKIRKRNAEQYGRTAEQSILRAARRHNGVVTASAIASELDLTIDEVRNELEKIVAKGIAYPEAADEGYVVFRFPELTAREKGRSG
jgi:hypothetical protein